MAPIRRYLRISKYSVLECRIFLENPADGPRWLLHPTDPALPRVFDAVKPYVLPKLREENERAKGKGKKKKSVKDVVKRDDFEVSIFLTEIGTRHSLLIKKKTFNEKKNKSTANKARPLQNNNNPIVLREDSDEEDIPLADIPLVQKTDGTGQHVVVDVDDDGSDNDSDIDGKFIDEIGQYEDKKKLGLNTTYEGFSIWGLVLCLLVDRKGVGKKDGGSGNAQALMQEWIASTQQQDDDG